MKIFIGYDDSEAEAYHTCHRSIRENTSGLVEIFPLVLEQLVVNKLYWRDPDPLASTKFTYSRYLAPYLCGYEGWSILLHLCLNLV